jgi:hypothetical protein
MKLTRFSIFFTVVVILTGCEEKEQPLSIPEDDVIQFGKIRELGEEAEKVWPGYNYYRTKPAYIILTDVTGTSPRGYFLNPPAPPDGSRKVNDEQSHGLDLYANNTHLSTAQSFLGSTLAFLPESMKVDGVTYFLLKDTKTTGALPFYYGFMDQFDNWTSLVTIHEMFHVYQFENWTFPPNTYQDFANYPINEEIISLELALFDLMKSVPGVTTSEQRRDHLARFVVLLEELFRVDPTSNKVIESMVPLQLFLEGTARYMEHYSSLNTIFPTVDEDVTHGWADYLETINSNTLIRHIFAVRIWYHVGAGALRLLEQTGVEFTDAIEGGATPYSIAVEHLKLTEEEKTNILSDIQASPQWAAHVERGKTLAAL